MIDSREAQEKSKKKREAGNVRVLPIVETSPLPNRSCCMHDAHSIPSFLVATECVLMVIIQVWSTPVIMQAWPSLGIMD
jgi:hypothetical protein